MRIDTAPIRRALADPAHVARLFGWPIAARQPRGVLVRCPVHGDGNASLSLTRAGDGTLGAKCFGCGFSGDILTLVASVNGLHVRDDFAEVARIAADMAALPIPDAAPLERDHVPPIPASTMRAVCEALLRACPLRGDVAAYLHGRGILDEARRDGWGALPRYHEQGALIDHLLVAFSPDILLGSGLVCRHNDGLLYFCHGGARVLIPWRDPAGAVYTVQRRRIDSGKVTGRDGAVREMPRYVFPAGHPARHPYGFDWGAHFFGLPVAWVEGAVDALAFRVLAKRRGWNARTLALPGVEAWRASWAEHARGRDVWAATDADAAGERAAEAIERDCLAAGAISVRRVRPDAKDWGVELVG